MGIEWNQAAYLLLSMHRDFIAKLHGGAWYIRPRISTSVTQNAGDDVL